MSRRSIDTGAYRYVIAPEIDLPVSQRIWEIVGTQLVDELNGGPPVGAVRLRCDNPNFDARVGSGGFAGLVAIPAKAVPLLAGKSYPATLSVAAVAYISDSRSVTIPADVAFPGSFTPLDIGVWPLHHNPISLYGVVNLATAAGLQPVAGASVSLTKLWRQANQPQAALDLLALTGPLGALRPAGSAVQAISLTTIGPLYQLIKEAGPGSTTVLLSNTVGLAAGVVLAFDAADVDRAEYATVAAISGALNPTQPASVTLTLPLQFLHLASIEVSQVAPAVAGAANTTGVDAIAGDCVLLLNQPMTGIASGTVVSISGGTAPVEYRIAGVFDTITDSVGNYRLPLMSRVAQLELTANDGVNAPVALTVIPEYRKQRNRIDFLLS